MLLAAGVGLIALRYDWGPEGGQVRRAGVPALAYLFLILLPTCFYLARWLLRSTRAAAIVTGVVFVITTLPYKLLGLDRRLLLPGQAAHLSRSTRSASRRSSSSPAGCCGRFPTTTCSGRCCSPAGRGDLGGLVAPQTRGAPPRAADPVLLTVAFAAICLQAAAHAGMRGPYTYLAYFQRAEAKQHWYHVYNFARRDRRGRG